MMKEESYTIMWWHTFKDKISVEHITLIVQIIVHITLIPVQKQGNKLSA